MTEHEERELLQKVRDLHIAVMGDDKLKQEGLLAWKIRMESWKEGINLRIAGIIGGCAVAGVAIKYFLKL